MKKCLITLFLLFSTVAFAKTWEVSLQECDGFCGFWFPNHNWIDEGESWIKPLMNGESLKDYGEDGISFYYSLLKNDSCSSNTEYCLAIYNAFDVWFTLDSSKNMGQAVDSVYFFIGCSGNPDCKREFGLENVITADFVPFYTVSSGGYFLPKGDTLSWSVRTRIPNLESLYKKRYSSKNGVYFIYKKFSEMFEYNALCNISVTPYKVQCEFQDDGTLNFDKLPDVKTIPEDFCSTQSISSVRWNRFKQKNNLMNELFYRADGTPAAKGSSNIIIQNNQPKLHLKGN